jgi:hypothetical protein
MREYGKVFSSIWESSDFRELSEDGRALVLYLLTCKHITIAGVFRLPDGYACEDLQWTPERVSEGFRNLESKGFATRCEVSKWVWVRKFLEWNQPENPNQRKAAVKQANSIPTQCAWKPEFMLVCGPSLGVSPPPSPPFHEDDYGNPSETVSEPFLNQKQEQEQEQKQEQENPTGTSPAKLPTCPSSELIALYHEVLPELPSVRLMSDKRKRALAKFWAWVLTTSTPDGTRRATTRDEALEWFRRYLERARDNDFLMGRTARNGDHAGWECDLDFLLTDKGMKHVIEKTLVREPA